MLRTRQKYTVLDLFCGAGGLSLGLEMAGFETVAGVDFDENAIETFRANHPNAVGLHADVCDVKGADILAKCGLKEIDVVAGGPSCQGFSTHGKRIESDPRNFLFKEYIRIVTELRPKFIIMENVKGLLTYSGGYFKELIESSFSEAGYRVESRILCAADYGVPQLRHRILFLGTRLDVPLTFPQPTHFQADDLSARANPYVTVEDALSDLPEDAPERLSGKTCTYKHDPKNAYQEYCRKGMRSSEISLHHFRPLSEYSYKIISNLKEGQGIRDLPEQLLPPRFKRMRRISTGELRKDCTTLYHRISWSEPSYTITCNFKNVASGPFAHPTKNRGITPREALRLMSFPDSYRFCGSKIPMQIGNAVPPLMAKAIGHAVMDSMRRARNPARKTKAAKCQNISSPLVSGRR